MPLMPKKTRATPAGHAQLDGSRSARVIATSNHGSRAIGRAMARVLPPATA